MAPVILMDKRLLLAGFALFILGSAISWIGTSQSIGQLQGSSTGYQQLGLRSGTDAYVRFSANGSASLIGAYQTLPNASIDYYIMNSSAFAAVSGTVASDGRLEAGARGLEGEGLVTMVIGSQMGQYPYSPAYGALMPAPEYSANYSVLPKGTYYIVFENPTNTDTTVFYSMAMSGAFASMQGQLAGAGTSTGVLGVLVAIVGLAIGVYSLFRKGKAKEELSQESIDRLYAGVEDRVRAPRRGSVKGAARKAGRRRRSR